MNLSSPDTAAVGTHVVARSAAEATALLPVRPNSVATRRILKAPGFTAVRIALDEGETMREHQAAVPVLIEVVSGTVDIDAAGSVDRLEAGGVLYVAERVPHSLYGVTPVQLLLILADTRHTSAPEDVDAHVHAGAVDHSGSGHVHTADQAHAHDHADHDHADHVHDDHAHLDHAEPAAGAAVEAPRLATVTPLVLEPKPADASCTCGEVDPPTFPELDARTVPHAIRHAVILGALDSLGPRDGLVLIAGHDPLPLLAQVRSRFGDRFAVTYLDRGPEAWRLQLAPPQSDGAA